MQESTRKMTGLSELPVLEKIQPHHQGHEGFSWHGFAGCVQQKCAGGRVICVMVGLHLGCFALQCFSESNEAEVFDD